MRLCPQGLNALPSAPFCPHYVPGELLSGDAGMCGRQGDGNSAGHRQRSPTSPAPRRAGLELRTRRGAHGPVSSAVRGDPAPRTHPCSLGMAVRAGRRVRPWERERFAQSFGPWRPPAISTNHQQWEASSIPRDLDSAPVTAAELCLALGWSCWCHQQSRVPRGVWGERGPLWVQCWVPPPHPGCWPCT